MSKDRPLRPAPVAETSVAETPSTDALDARAGVTRLGALDLEAHLRDPSRKQAFVTPMFDIIAPRYDAFTRLFSFGMDASWKRDALTSIVRGAQGATDALDLACGTGDLAVAIARALPNMRVTALDASPRMIDEANRRLSDATRDGALASRVTTMVGDMAAIAVPTASVDLVTAGYGVRNVPDPTQSVREMARVMRPGALLVTLDFYRPAVTPWRVLLLWYLSLAGNAVGWWWHRDPIVYGYIARSIDTFMSWQQFSALLEREGFRVERVTRHLGGGIAVHEARRLP
jgi:demethylmenaquinone methyltransferase/2-methoxy-6-polyprenyl-1,4-benzoquinol methylase